MFVFASSNSRIFRGDTFMCTGMQIISNASTAKVMQIKVMRVLQKNASNAKVMQSNANGNFANNASNAK
jgi:hypothetical protein